MARDTSLCARRRAALLRDALADDGIALVEHPGLTVVEPADAVDASGGSGATAGKLPPGGETAGLAALKRWAATSLPRYADGHDDSR